MSRTKAQRRDRQKKRDPEAYRTKALPHSEECERAALAAILLSPDTLPIVTARLSSEDFYLERHQAIFECMLEIQERGEEIDMRTLQGRLELRGKFDLVGGLAYLAGLDLDLPDLGRIESYVEIVKERSIRRQLIQGAQRITFDAFESGEDAATVLAEAESMFSGLGDEAAPQGFSRAGDILARGIETMEEAQHSGGIVGLSTGFYDWDQMSQGLCPGDLIVVAGRPGQGKSAVSLDVARHVTIRLGEPAAVFSMEMSEQQLGQRLISAESGIPLSSVRSGNMSEEQWEEIYRYAKVDPPLFIDESSSPTPAEIGAKCRRLKSEHGLSLVVVDYLQLMHVKGFDNRHLEIGYITSSLKALAKDLHVPIMVLSQLSRKCEDRADKRPFLSDLRDSGSPEADADMVCFVYRDEVYNEHDPDVKGLAELIVRKHRSGRTGTVDLVFIGELTSFRNLDRHHAGHPDW